MSENVVKKLKVQTLSILEATQVHLTDGGQLDLSQAKGNLHLLLGG